MNMKTFSVKYILAGFILIGLLFISVSYADFGSSATYKMGVGIVTDSEAGSSTSYKASVGSALSGDSYNSSSYRVILGFAAAASLVSAADDLSFTIYIPANNATGKDTSLFAQTDSIVFNITDTNARKINATAAGGQGGQQDAAVSMFRYENTGTVALNITLNFTDSVPAAITMKAGWSDASYQTRCSSVNLVATGSCANISVGGAPQQPVIIANMTAIGARRDVWLWADYDTYTPGSDVSSSLSHSSGKS